MAPSRSPVARAAFVAAAVLALASSAFAYEFFFAKDLEATLEKQVNKQVKVVDKLVKIWSEQEVEGWLRFDTVRFRCAIPTSETEGIAYIREVMKEWETFERNPDAKPPLVAIYGTVKRPPFWGEPRDEGKNAGVDEDQIVIVADKVERPRERFYEEGY